MEHNKIFPVSQPSITKKEISYVNKAMKSGWISSLGKYIENFENTFAEYIGVKYALTTSNGTTGLHLALSALKIGPGDEVIIPDLTFIATANAITYTGAKPIIVDIEPNTLCINPDEVLKAITKKTRAIIPVHLYGHPSDMDKINSIAQEFNLSVIEDAAEAHGATYKGIKTGGLSDIGVFSFYGNKIITTGEGGMITTNNEDYYDYAKFLRDHAMSRTKRYFHTEIGFNYRMTNIQAAIGVAQMERIEIILQQRKKLISWYREYLDVSNSIRLNYEAEWASSSYWMICLEIDGLNEVTRLNLMKALKDHGIDTRPYFTPISMMPMYQNAENPISKSKSIIGLNLPTYFKLTRKDVKYICAVINREIKIL